MFHPDLPRIQSSTVHHTHYIHTSLHVQLPFQLNITALSITHPLLTWRMIECVGKRFYDLLSWVTAIHLPPVSEKPVCIIFAYQSTGVHTKQEYLFSQRDEDIFRGACDVSPREGSLFSFFAGGAEWAKTCELCDLAALEEETFVLSVRCCFTLRTPPSGPSHTHWLNAGSVSFYNLSQLLFFWLLFPLCKRRSLAVCVCVWMSCQNALWQDSVCDVTVGRLVSLSGSLWHWQLCVCV